MVRLAGFEPAAYGLEVRCSIRAELQAHIEMASISYVGLYVHRNEGSDSFRRHCLAMIKSLKAECKNLDISHEKKAS